MAGTGKQKTRENPPHGHVCYVCGMYKADEAFSGRGYPSYICTACAALSDDERRALVVLRKIRSMASRHLSGSEITWLWKKTNDSNPQIAQDAREAYNAKFPRFAFWEKHKGLTVLSLDLLIHGNGWDMNGDESPIHARVTLDHTGLIRRTDYTAPEGERETETTMDKKEARGFLSWVLNKLDVLFWDEDLSDAEIAGNCGDPLNLMPDLFPDIDWEDGDGAESMIPDTLDTPDTDMESEHPIGAKEPLCSLHLELSSGTDKVIAFYNRLPDEALALYWALAECLDEGNPDGENESPPLF